ncbi:hypothetical protein [Sphingopyxis solisilvae]|uniref:hypothetical protein n=1 Tax=Sphingopyxis solisilvae TaxID=1886788 RepID=UPI001892B92B|nr:hypothetical protein [Sphingopyxis solisilvae]
MSITVGLAVSICDSSDGSSRTEEWGLIDVVAIPNVGATVDVEREGTLEVIEVTSVHHFAVPNPLPDSIMPNSQRKLPSIKVFGEWRAELQWDME